MTTDMVTAELHRIGVPEVTTAIIDQLKQAGAYEAILEQIGKDGGGNPNHDERGLFASGAGSAAKWLAGAAAVGVIGAAVAGLRNPETAKKVLAAAISAGISAVGKMDQGNMQDDAVRAEVENFAANVQVAAGRAKEIMSKAVQAMIKLRTGEIQKSGDDVLDNLRALAAALDRVGVEKAGEGNPNHDDHGRFSSGDGGGAGGDTKSVGKTAADIQSSMADLAGDLDSLADDVTSAHDAHQEVSGELGDGEEFTEPADQKDWEDRLESSGNEAAAATQKLRDHLEKMIKAAQDHIATLDNAYARAPY